MLGTAQTLAWASSYYLPAINADRIAHDLGLSSTWFFAAFSGALVISAMVGPRVGRTVDAIGGREVLAFSNVVIAAGLVISPSHTRKLIERYGAGVLVFSSALSVAALLGLCTLPFKSAIAR